MKSYLQGMITGGIMVFAIIVFMGQGSPSEVISNQYAQNNIFDSIDETYKKRKEESQRRINQKKNQNRYNQEKKLTESQLNIGKYITGLDTDSGKLLYWVTDTQTSFTYVAKVNPLSNTKEYWSFNYEEMQDEFAEQENNK
jgi:hypothetical protein